jgi:hypothetical protein
LVYYTGLIAGIYFWISATTHLYYLNERVLKYVVENNELLPIAGSDVGIGTKNRKKAIILLNRHSLPDWHIF